MEAVRRQGECCLRLYYDQICSVGMLALISDGWFSHASSLVCVEKNPLWKALTLLFISVNGMVQQIRDSVLTVLFMTLSTTS